MISLAGRSTRVERLVLAVLLGLVFIMAARTPLDSDLWWHLRAGQITLDTGKPVLVDTFSYTRAGAAWVNHSWLAQAVLFGLFEVGGPLALSALVAGLAVISMYWLYRSMEGNPLTRAFLIILAAVVAAPVWTIRPQMASFALLCLTGYILYLYKWKQLNRLWLLPLLFILWSNLHGGYVLGLIFIALEILGSIVDHILFRTEIHPTNPRKTAILAITGIACTSAVLINPNGINTWVIPFQTIGVQTLQQLISEWASPDFHQVTQFPFLVLLFLTGFSVALSKRRLDSGDFLLLAGFGVLALFARRNFGPFAVAAAPVLSRHLGSAFQAVWAPTLSRVNGWLANRKIDLTKYRPEPGKNLRASPWINGILLLVLGLAAVVKWVGVSSPDIVASYERQLYPLAAVEWLEGNPPDGPIFNSYDWGGYLIWKIQDLPVFVDGRTDLYHDEILGQWVKVVNGQQGWKEIMDYWDIQLVIIEPHWPINRLLPMNGWSILYQDEQAVIYGR